MPFNVRSSGSHYAIFDDSKLSSNKTYTLPDQSGYLVASDTPGTSSYSVTASYATTASYALSGVGGGGVTIGGPTDSGLNWDQYAGTPNRYMLVSDGVTNDITASHMIQLDTNNETINIYAGIEGIGNHSISLGAGSVYASNFFGTASLATTASYSSTASYVLGGGGATVTNAANNRLITSDGTAGGLNGETNLTFDGSELGINGTLAMSGTGEVKNALMVGYTEKIITKSMSVDYLSGTLAPDLSLGNTYRVTLNANIVDFNPTNDPASTELGTLTLILVGNGTVYTVNWGSSVTWQGSTPSVVSTLNNADIYTFVSVNGGTEWLGIVNAQNLGGLI